MSRRGGDAEIDRRDIGVVSCGEVADVEWEVPHSHEVDKNQEGYLGSVQSQPQARPHSPGFQHQEDKAP